jgi:hypothetical protein
MHGHMNVKFCDPLTVQKDTWLSFHGIKEHLEIVHINMQMNNNTKG